MSLYQQLYRSLKADIVAQRLTPGARLPSIRQMMRDAGVSRTTIESAYEQLCADGLVSCVPQSGYYVNDMPARRPMEAPVACDPPEPLFRYDFSGQRMDPQCFDFAIWRRLSHAVTANQTPFLGYGNRQGEHILRQHIAAYLSAGRGVYAAPQNIVISAGIQSLLSILCEMFDKSQKRIAFENPGFRKGHRIFADHGYDTVFVCGDRAGVNLDELNASGANMLYLSPSHSFPFGATLPHSKRIALLRWAERTDAVLFEDDYDGELRYTGKPLATLSSLDAHGRVIYLGTFSKLLPPSIRISYAVIPDRLLPLYRRIAARYNQTSSTMEQLTMARFIAEGRLERQIRRLRRIYAHKNALISQAFAEQFGERALVCPNDTGLHVIVSLLAAGDAREMCEKARQVGIHIIPMSSYQMEEGAGDTTDFYLSCAGISEQDIVPAVALLRDIWS